MESQALESTDELNDNTTDPKPQRCGIAWLAIVLLLVTWLALFLSLTFFWKKNNSLFTSYEARFTQIQKQLSQNQTNYQELQKKIFSNKLQTQISHVHQLIQQAQDDLVYLHDLNNALAALTLANKRLTELPGLSIPKSLQSLLTQTIVSLKALPLLDLSNALAQLNFLQTQVMQLPFITTTPMANKASITSSNTQTTTEKKWLTAIQASLRSFQQLIVIRHLDKPIEPLLPQAQQQYLQHNLQLLLQQAQWALLQRQQAVYQTSLQQTKEAIQQHFLVSSPQTQTVIQAIDALARINLQPNLPDLTPILAAIASLEKTIVNAATEQKERS